MYESPSHVVVVPPVFIACPSGDGEDDILVIFIHETIVDYCYECASLRRDGRVWILGMGSTAVIVMMIVMVATSADLDLITTGYGHRP